ncbi:MAG: TIGR00159 family protein [Lachnospiraceae bacterium]|jgi:diadenylate cyclase|nr:TIGR00159 family protein [Lachnospiraceae bacterium]MCI8966682.1 TIGR00159 family protein [Lachnospiraceae bacterium]MDE6939593.1 diadenylate cyclase CdaA [Lachnospiraceae bacterium]MDE6989692.1 diadenylate cyclase CdaA [Lachnospiraceae bacterium]MDE7000050.1 diadenylate cyclase CdaA [Lachnospiraceae bacterium]
MDMILERLGSYMETLSLRSFNIRWQDIVEVIIISFLLYQIMAWVKHTKVWLLMKGIVIIMAFILFAIAFKMHTIIWIVEHVLSIAVTAMIVILQPELRHALEELGRKSFVTNLITFEKPTDERFSDKTVNDLVKASFEMGKVKTGALMVIEQNVLLTEYERTGIEVDGLISSQLIINIFEHNTPLHDGAVIIRGNRVISATCYLPLSDNMEISKELGTRHRAAVGISEVTDALTIIVSEETGHVSVTYEGKLYRNLDANGLREKISMIQNKEVEDNKKRRLWKGRAKDEK